MPLPSSSLFLHGYKDLDATFLGVKVIDQIHSQVQVGQNSKEVFKDKKLKSMGIQKKSTNKISSLIRNTGVTPDRSTDTSDSPVIKTKPVTDENLETTTESPGVRKQLFIQENIVSPSTPNTTKHTMIESNSLVPQEYMPKKGDSVFHWAKRPVIGRNKITHCWTGCFEVIEVLPNNQFKLDKINFPGKSVVTTIENIRQCRPRPNKDMSPQQVADLKTLYPDIYIYPNEELDGCLAPEPSCSTPRTYDGNLTVPAIFTPIRENLSSSEDSPATKNCSPKIEKVNNSTEPVEIFYSDTSESVCTEEEQPDEVKTPPRNSEVNKQITETPPSSRPSRPENIRKLRALTDCPDKTLEEVSPCSSVRSVYSLNGSSPGNMVPITIQGSSYKAYARDVKWTDRKKVIIIVHESSDSESEIIDN